MRGCECMRVCAYAHVNARMFARMLALSELCNQNVAGGQVIVRCQKDTSLGCCWRRANFTFSILYFSLRDSGRATRCRRQHISFTRHTHRYTRDVLSDIRSNPRNYAAAHKNRITPKQDGFMEDSRHDGILCFTTYLLAAMPVYD